MSRLNPTSRHLLSTLAGPEVCHGAGPSVFPTLGLIQTFLTIGRNPLRVEAHPSDPSQPSRHHREAVSGRASPARQQGHRRRSHAYPDGGTPPMLAPGLPSPLLHQPNQLRLPARTDAARVFSKTRPESVTASTQAGMASRILRPKPKLTPARTQPAAVARGVPYQRLTQKPETDPYGARPLISTLTALPRLALLARSQVGLRGDFLAERARPRLTLQGRHHATTAATARTGVRTRSGSQTAARTTATRPSGKPRKRGLPR
jgi:hypothetical protein